MTCECDDYYGGGCSGSDGSGSNTPSLIRNMHSNLITHGTWITLEEAKHHCRVDISDDDAYITSLIAVASEYVTSRTGAATAAVRWHGELISFPATDYDPIILPNGPLDPDVAGVINWINKDGSGDGRNFGDSRNAEAYNVIRSDSVSPAIVTTPNAISDKIQTWPDADPNPSGIEIAWTTLPSSDAMIKHAGLMLIANWYTSREPVTAGLSATNMPVPYTLDVLLGSSTQQVYFPK
jgi:uncharacterized phiE125 gp8 family phage protein